MLSDVDNGLKNVTVKQLCPFPAEVFSQYYDQGTLLKKQTTQDYL